MVKRYRLSLTVGPVQSFVVQARRTRDLWTGSWLLSFLSEVALASAEENGGKAIIPFRGDNHGNISSIDSAIGGIPNRFEVSFESQDAAIGAAKKAQVAFSVAWKSIGKIVWNKYVEQIANERTRLIWERQVANFWEVSWVVTPEGKPNELAGLALNCRKQFRNVPIAIEEGTKCSMMKDLQEISGFAGLAERQEQKEFWRKFRDKVSSIDLKIDECLCAIGVIKRFYPEVVDEHIESFIGKKPSRSICEQSRWPSLGFFAALPWLLEVEKSQEVTSSPLDAAQNFANEAKRKEVFQGTTVNGYWESETVPAMDFDLGGWANIDATVWHPAGLANNLIGFSRPRMQLLSNMQGGVFEMLQGRKPIPYYAMLLADGDSMGRLLAALNDPSLLSCCLDTFCKDVTTIVSQNQRNGRVVYAGGDDVFALLSAKTALDAAKELSDSYRRAFSNTSAKGKATLSVAIVYSNFKFPLASTIRIAHNLLDDVAKEKTGRDSIALGLIQGSGLNAVWSSPWDLAFPAKGTPLTGLHDLFASGSKVGVATNRDDETATFNSSYLQTLRSQYTRLFPKSIESPGAHQKTELGTEVLLQLAHSEYRRRMSVDDRAKSSPHDTQPLIDQLMSLSYPRRRLLRGDEPEFELDKDKFGFDGWKIARFLKQVAEGAIIDHE